MAGFADHTGQLPTTFLHLLRMTFINLITRFHNHHVTAVFLAAVTDVRYTVGNDVIGIQFGVPVHGPIGIERHAYHIKLTAVFQDGVKIEVVEALIVTPVQMYDDDGLREHLLHGIVTSADETGVLLRRCIDVSHRPQQPVGGFVAHLHPSGCDVVLLQQREHLNGVVT